jgi:hypothetical protein
MCENLFNNVFKSKLSTLLAFIEKSLVQITILRSSRMISPLAMRIPCEMSHEGEVDDIEQSSRPNVKTTWIFS